MDLQLCCHAKLPSDGINVHLAVLASLNHTQKQYETDQNTDKLNVNKIWTPVCKFNCKQELCVIDIFCRKLTKFKGNIWCFVEIEELRSEKNWVYFYEMNSFKTDTLPTAEILSGKNARAWVSMVLYLKKYIKTKKILGAV